MHVPAGEEGGPGGLENLLKAEEKGWEEKGWEKKKGDDNDEADELGERRG